MAFDSSNGTKLANLFNPQVVADLFRAKLTNAIKFSPLCRMDYTLQGRPGSVITVPTYAYIGDATTVGEGVDITVSKLVESTDTATIHKIAKGVELTDEAVLSGYGDPVGEAVNQLILSVASQADNEVLATLGGIATGMTVKSGVAGKLSADNIADALVLFGEDIDGEKVLLIGPNEYADLRKADDWCPASEIAAQMIINGAVGMIHGCQVVVSNKLKNKNLAYIVKPGALAMYMKRDAEVETDRDIIGKYTVLTADQHFVTYLYDASKAIKISEAV